MNIKNILLAAGLITLAIPLFASNVFAAGSSTCEVIYGGGQVCTSETKLSIDKSVMASPNAATKGGNRPFVDNVTINDPRYNPSQEVVFSIKVENQGTDTFDKVDVTDTLPDYLDFVSGSVQMSVDSSNKKKISYSVSNLEAGKTNTQTITARIVDSGSLPADKGIVCVMNQAQAMTRGSVVSDTAQVCIEKQTPTQTTKPAPTVYPAPKGSTTPPTGPESIALLGLIPSGIAGLLLRKRSTILK